jgi:hypothetical protein
MLLTKESVKQVLAIIDEFVEKEGNKTIVEFIEGWNKNNNKRIERI